MNITYPELKKRIQSTLIDAFFIIFLMAIFSNLFGFFGESPDWLHAAVFIGIWVLYEPLCTSLGSTLGNYLMGIRVRKYDDPENRINFLQAIVRYAIKIFLGWISFLTMHRNEERRAIHDLMAGSVMINAPVKTALA